MAIDHSALTQMIKMLEREKKLSLDAIENHFHTVGEDVVQCMEFIEKINELDINSKDRSIQLMQNVDLLCQNSIQKNLSDKASKNIQHIEILTSVGSSNGYLKSQAMFSKHAHICLAEHQTEGRGRRGKTWFSPFAQNIYLSIARRFEIPAENIGLLSLVVGIALADTLSEMSLDDIKIKWPNDIYWKNQKLAGILIDAKDIQPQQADLIIGIGINVHMQESSSHTINQPWVALAQILDSPDSRNQIAAQIINRVLEYSLALENTGFSNFVHKWQSYDYLLGKVVDVKGHVSQMSGVASGINEKGELLILKNGSLHPMHAGELSVRLVPEDS